MLNRRPLGQFLHKLLKAADSLKNIGAKLEDDVLLKESFRSLIDAALIRLANEVRKCLAYAAVYLVLFYSKTKFDICVSDVWLIYDD